MTARFDVAAAALALTLLVGSCAGDGPPAPTTTSGTALPPRVTRPTVPPATAPGASTTTTVPAEIATDIDACDLLESDELGDLAGEDPGPGTPIETIDRADGSDPSEEGAGSGTDMSERPSTTGEVAPTTVPAEDVPTVLLSSCSWPTDKPPALTLTYLYPTTSQSAREHLQRVVELGTRFGDGARVFPLAPVGSIAPAALQAPDGTISEVAAVTGSALLYVVPAKGPAAGSPEATALVAVTVAAARKAPG